MSQKKENPKSLSSKCETDETPTRPCDYDSISLRETQEIDIAPLVELLVESMDNPFI